MFVDTNSTLLIHSPAKTLIPVGQVKLPFGCAFRAFFLNSHWKCEQQLKRLFCDPDFNNHKAAKTHQHHVCPLANGTKQVAFIFSPMSICEIFPFQILAKQTGAATQWFGAWRPLAFSVKSQSREQSLCHLCISTPSGWWLTYSEKYEG
jgi:hypothetical protein